MIRTITRALIGGGVYSYNRVQPDEFLLAIWIVMELYSQSLSSLDI